MLGWLHEAGGDFTLDLLDGQHFFIREQQGQLLRLLRRYAGQHLDVYKRQVLIMALFAQQPLPFFVALGLWLALCTAGGTLLRYTDSHAFVLSGFTAVIVAVLSIPDPENTFMLAVVRVTETLLGVACVAPVSYTI